MTAQDVVTMANHFQEQTIEQRFHFTWPLICKLACMAMIFNTDFEQMCVHALTEAVRRDG